MDKIKIKLLIVDDEKDIRDSLKDILIDEGYEVHLAENALEAKKIKLELKKQKAEDFGVPLVSEEEFINKIS